MIRIGTAGWGIPGQFAGEFPQAGSGLERYSGRFGAVEINTTFHRPHRPSTFQRWVESVPDAFRFAVKLPKSITHELRLVDAAEALRAFLESIGPLHDRLGPLLVQLPPSLAYDGASAESFLRSLRAQFSGLVALEPRHPTWFDPDADGLLVALQVGRVAADPARVPTAAIPGGWGGLAYYRLHGSPDMYRSAYDASFLSGLADKLAQSDALERWCIFDNTTLGAAAGNALALSTLLGSPAALLEGNEGSGQALPDP